VWCVLSDDEKVREWRKICDDERTSSLTSAASSATVTRQPSHPQQTQHTTCYGGATGLF
jgi:hypothetical protein